MSNINVRLGQVSCDVNVQELSVVRLFHLLPVSEDRQEHVASFWTQHVSVMTSLVLLVFGTRLSEHHLVRCWT